MLRSFIPFILVSLGFTLILWTDRKPLYEWQVGENSPDFSAICDGDVPTQLVTRFGESLDKSNNSQNMDLVVKLSPKDEVLDHLSLALGSWLFIWSLIETVMSLIYMWRFLLWDMPDGSSRLGLAMFLTVLAIFICLNLSQLARRAGPVIGWIPYFSFSDCQGTIIFSAKVVKVYYETLALRFTGILFEAGALGLMAQPFTRVVESSKSGVG